MKNDFMVNPQRVLQKIRTITYIGTIDGEFIKTILQNEKYKK